MASFLLALACLPRAVALRMPSPLLSPPARCPPPLSLSSPPSRLDLNVARDPSTGSFGLDVDQDNTVAYNAGEINPDLLLGDVIVAVNGELLDGRPVGAVLSGKEPPYTFTVERDPSLAISSLERVLLQIVADNPIELSSLPTFDAIPRGFGQKASAIVQSLEGSVDGQPLRSAEELGAELQGFWKLLLTSDAEFAGEGLSGFGSSPFCAAAAHFQLFGDGSKGPPMQTVELIANAKVGSHQLAALKGEFELAPPSVIERYSRSEFSGSPQLDAPLIERTTRTTFLSKQLRICRIAKGDGEEESVCVYTRQEQGVAQGEISELLERPVAPSDEGFDPRPAWERASSASSDAADAYLGGTDGSGAYGGGGGGRGGAGAM